jgi:CDP-glucose 4,6-dehydratase
VLQALRGLESKVSCVVVTSDKCYENRDWVWPYREDDALGGFDPYSASKACAEIVVSAFSRSFFASESVSVASARSGNVIGGGDWSAYRLIPDIVRAYQESAQLVLRNPSATRPWQHVLEPLCGYLMLAEGAWDDPAARGAWNFGPDATHERNVEWVTNRFIRAWGAPKHITITSGERHEARALALDSSKARHILRWEPRLDIDTTIEWTAGWYSQYTAGRAARDLCIEDISRYSRLL